MMPRVVRIPYLPIMKPAFLFFSTLVLGTCFAQTDTALVGKYVSVEQRGLHTYPGATVGDLHYLPYTYQVDTTITKTISLDENHQVCLQLDTAVLVGFHGTKYGLLGKWELVNDTIQLTFTESSVLYPFSLDGKEPQAFFNNLVAPITSLFSIYWTDDKIYRLDLLSHDRSEVYVKILE
jgi:hypothetical protein